MLGPLGSPVDAHSAEQAEDDKLSLATATADELRTLDGIGPALARRIVEHRERVGGFASVDDLGAVEGIGAKRLRDLREAVRP